MEIVLFSVRTEIDQVVAKHVTEIWGCNLERPTEDEVEKFSPELTKITDLMKDENLATDDLTVVVGTGCKTLNGHAFLYDSKPIVWLSLSNYSSSKSAKIFFLHEILHGVHYEQSPDYCFKDQTEKNHVGRQLVTEGLATCATKQIYKCSDNEVLWADYLSTEECATVTAQYIEKEKQSAENILADWDRSDRTYFYANDSSDVDTYRSGYYIGLRVFQKLNAKSGLTFRDFAKMSRNELDKLVMKQLKEMI